MKVRGIAMWARVHEAADPFGDDKPKFSIDLIINDKKELKRLKDEGLNPKKKKSEDGFPVFSFETLAKDSQGNDRRPPAVVDRSGSRDFYEPIGNGSDVVVMFTPREWNMKGRKGIKGYLNGVQVLNHVAYGETFDSYDEEDGVEDQGPANAEASTGGEAEDFWDSETED